MGSMFSFHKRNRGASRTVNSSDGSSRNHSSTSGNAGIVEEKVLSKPSMSSGLSTGSHGQSSTAVDKLSVKKKYGFIPDNFSSLEQVFFLSLSFLVFFIFVSGGKDFRYRAKQIAVANFNFIK